LKPTNQNIEQLLEQCIVGDQHAQMEVYNRYYKAMYNTAYRIVKDSAEAEDVMQDSFLTAFTKLSNLKEKVTFGSWLKRIVVNNSIYHYNQNSKYNDVPLDISYANCRTTISRAKESLRQKLAPKASNY